ncbi:MAG TPA: serine hydrolase [bacterium]
MGVYVRAATTGEETALNADRPFQMASVFKIPILAELLSQAHAGRRSLDDRVILTNEMKAPGSGVLKELSAGTPLTVRDLATLMIIVSDNTATDILLGLVTKEAVNARLSVCGLNAPRSRCPAVSSSTISSAWAGRPTPARTGRRRLSGSSGGSSTRTAASTGTSAPT